MTTDERIAQAREQIHEIQQMAARLARQQKELHEMIWELRGNIVMM